MKKWLFSILIFSELLYAGKNNDLQLVFESAYGKNITIKEKVLTLTSTDKKRLQTKASAKIDMSKVRFYTIHKNTALIGYGVLMIQTIRTKKAAILYLIEKDERIKAIEILLFKEPSEYKPATSWEALFIGKSRKDNLIAGDGIPTISGATLSARAVSNAARIALEIVAENR